MRHCIKFITRSSTSKKCVRKVFHKPNTRTKRRTKTHSATNHTFFSMIPKPKANSCAESPIYRQKLKKKTNKNKQVII